MCVHGDIEEIKRENTISSILMFFGIFSALADYLIIGHLKRDSTLGGSFARTLFTRTTAVHVQGCPKYFLMPTHRQNPIGDQDIASLYTKHRRLNCFNYRGHYKTVYVGKRTPVTMEP